MKKSLPFIASIVLLLSCEKPTTPSFSKLTKGSPSISGKTEYLNSPMVTAGDRLYLIGHQDGSFPELGWHIKDEMGGIWNHPVKLMDGFSIDLQLGEASFSLDKAFQFTNFPYANKHSYTWPQKDLDIARWQFVPDGKQGMIIQLQLRNNGETKSLDVKFTGHTDLRPTWLGERTQMHDGQDEANFDKKTKAWIVKDSKNEWYSIFGSTTKPIEHSKEKNSYKGLGVGNSITYNLHLPAGETKLINFTLAGSYTSQEDAITNYTSVRDNIAVDISEKRKRYQEIARQSKLSIPDKDIEQAFEWTKYNCDWLVRTVPEIGSGIGAGIPDYPWWFGVDSEYALQGYMAIGQKEAVYNTIKLLDSVSNALNGNGRIIHEMSTNGSVFNKGNVNETPQFASLIWKIYQWNGDKAFLEAYFPIIEKGFNWVMNKQDGKNNLFPTGPGMMEIHGLDSEMIDVASYTQKAFADASLIASEIGKDGLSLGYAEIAKQLKKEINDLFWNEEFGSYADFIGTKEQTLKLIDDAIVRADTLGKPWAVEELNHTKRTVLANPDSTARPYVIYHNWVVNTPMEVGLAPPYKALKALTTAEQFVNPFGVFVTGIDRDELAGSDDGSFKGSKTFSYTGAVMTLPTGVQIVAENNYGRPDKALNYMKKMSRSFSYALPGSTYEVSPDYGMITQAWNIYGYAVPIVEQFFGIKPNAALQKVTINPQMPLDWDKAALENVAVGNNEISVLFSRKNGQTTLEVTQTQSSWEVEIMLPREPMSSFEVINGETLNSISEDFYIFQTKDKNVTIVLFEGES